MPNGMYQLSHLQLTEFVVSNERATVNELRPLKELGGMLDRRNLGAGEMNFDLDQGILRDMVLP